MKPLESLRVAAVAGRVASVPSMGLTYLREIVFLRWVMISGQAALVVILARAGILTTTTPMLVIGMALLAAFNLLTWLRLRQPVPVKAAELFLQAVLDVAALTGLLFLAGGTSNPLLAFYIVPLTMSAAALGRGYTLTLMALMSGAYFVLVFNHVPMAVPGPEDPAHLMHIAGEWLTHAIAGSLIAYFVWRISRSLKDHEKLLSSAREAELTNQNIIKLGGMAAGAAHELSTPLATMAVLISEMKADCAGQQECAVHESSMASLKLLESQIQTCKGILTNMLAATGSARLEEVGGTQLEPFLRRALAHFERMRPEARVRFDYAGPLPGPAIVGDPALKQAIVTLLNNAADAAPGEEIRLVADFPDEDLRIRVLDRGAGLPESEAGRVGTPFFTTKPAGKGHGLGLFLARSSVRRLGGSADLRNRPGGGAEAELRLPVESLCIAEAPK